MINTRFKIPCIKLFIVISEVDQIRQTKTIYFYNWLEITEQWSNFANTISNSLLSVCKIFKGNLITKSVYFAYSALKYFASFLPKHKIDMNNKEYLADVLNNFHGYKNTSNYKLFKHRLFKPETGYINLDKFKFSCELSEELIDKLTKMPLIPFNQLNHNIIVSF